MKLSLWAGRLHRQDGLPKDIYISLVGSLYQDARSLFIGSIAAIAAAIITAVWTGAMWLLLYAFAMPAVAYLRAADVGQFNRRRQNLRTAEAARVWELRYVIGSAASVALMGAWCVMTFAVSENDFLRILTFAGVVAYMIGISGRQLLQPAPCQHATRLRHRTALRVDLRGWGRILAAPAAGGDTVGPEHRLDFGAPAPHASRRAGVGARSDAVGDALRYRAEQYAAWPFHVRRGSLPGRRPTTAFRGCSALRPTPLAKAPPSGRCWPVRRGRGASPRRTSID